VAGFDVGGGLRVDHVGISDRTHYPLSVLATPGDVLRLRITYRPELVSAAQASDLAGHLATVLSQVDQPAPAVRRQDEIDGSG
jgi:hypothetical protein